MKSSPRRKAKKTAKKKAGKKVARSAKRATKPKAKKKVARKAKSVAKPKAKKKVARKAKSVAQPKAAKKSVKVELGPVQLSARTGIKNIAELNDALMAVHAADSAIVVDAGDVESIDTAALQLLVAFSNSLRNQSRVVEWRQASTVFCESAELLGLTEALRIGDASLPAENDDLCPVF